MDDQAIGGGAGASMGKTAAESADHSGPLEERIVSKNWNVRAQAYDDLKKLCENTNVNSKEPFFIDHADKWKIYLKDTNPGALEKALNCLEQFLKKIQPKQLVDSQNGIITIICEKMLLTHAKPGIKAKSLECYLLLFEVTENFDDSIETLQGLLKHKNVKVLSNACMALGQLVSNYGVKKVKIAEYAEVMLKNAQNTNPECKKQSYAYYKAVYKWIGDMIVPQIEDKLKKAQMDDIKKLFEEQKASGDKTKRFTRKEAIKEKERLEEEAYNAAMAAENGEAPPGDGGDGGGEGGAPKEEPPVDPLEFAPTKDILAEFTPEWMETTAAIKKWNEKKEQLDKVIAAAQQCKIKKGNFGPMAEFLNKEIRATNVNTAMAAINVVTALANPMKEDFGDYVKVIVEGVLLKYKEKRPVVQEACNNCTDALVKCCNLEEISEQVIPCITNVAPGVKLGTIKFVEKHIVVTYIDVLKRVSDTLLPAMAKVVDDKDGTVRDQAIHCFGLLKGRLGEDMMQKFIKDLNPQKTEKMNEAAKEIKVTIYDKPKGWKPPAPKKPKKVEENKDEDELDGDMSPPKRPVKKKKAVKKKVPANNDEESEKKPVAESTPQKNKPAAGSTKGPTAPVIADDNLGSGIDPEAAVSMVEQSFGGEIIANFSSAKWQEKAQGFEGLQAEIRENQPDSDMLEAVAKFIKVKMKDFKESNINLQKGTVATFNVMATESQAMSKRALAAGMNFFVDKIGDVKLSKLIMEMLMNAAEVCGPNFVALQIIKYAATAKAPNTIKEGCNFITQMIDEFGPQIPLKETIDYAKVAAAHSTPAVRQAGIKLFKELFKHAGDVIRTFMTEIKESTLKLIDGELKQVTQYGKGEHQPTRELRGAAAAAAGAGKKKGAGGGGGGGGGGIDSLLDSLPRQDISKKLSSKILDQYGHKDWKVRKKCGDDVEAILKEAKMRIEPNGLNELMDVMKKAMKDANKAVVKVFIILLGLLADALGSPISKYQKKCFVPMLSNLSDKQALVREEVIKCMNKWAEAIGPEKVINHLGEIILVENPESRGEGLKWIALHESSVPNSDTASLVKPLVACLTDKSKAIRELAETVGAMVMTITGHPTFLSATKDRPQAVQQTLKPILERIKGNCGGGDAEPAAKGGKGGKAAAVQEDEPEEDAPKPPNSFEKKALEKKQKEKAGNKSPRPAGRKAAPEEDELTITPQNKKKREQYDTRTKYPLNEVKGDHVERLQNACQDIFGLKFSDQMFAKNTDFGKHIKCVEQIETCIENQPGELMEILDILFKWGNLRMTDSSNTKLAGAFFDFYQKLLSFLVAQDYQMAEFEVVVLLGTLCDKTGHNIKIMAEKARQLVEMCYKVYEPKLCFKMIMVHGVGSKNLKAVAECLDIVASYVRNNGVDSITKKDFAIFLEKANSGDKNVRENTLRVFAETYKVLREDIWRLLGKDINSKVKGLLEQRFKQVGAGGLGNSSRGGIMNASGRSGGARDALGRSGGPATLQPRQPAAVVEEMPPVDNDPVMQPPADELPIRSGSGRRFQSSRSPARMSGAKAGGGFQRSPEQPVEHNTQMRDMFHPDAAKSHQRDVDMMDDGADAVAQVVSQKQQPSLTIDEALSMAEMQMETDPELRKHMDAIQKHIDQLKVGDLLKRVDSLVALNEVISATGQNNDGGGGDENSATKVQQRALIRLCDKLINAFSQVMIDIFSFPVKEIPLRFTKYFITIVNKTCSSKEIMKEVSCEEVRSLVDQLLQRLLIDNLDKIGSNKEGELILKNLNSSMLRMLENCNHTYIFVVLFGLLTKYKDSTDQPKIPSLIIKCLLKLSKNMDKLIEKVDLKKFMVAIHEYLVTIPLDKKTQNDDLGTRIAKTLINEIVKLKRNDIWEYYQVIEQHPEQDNHLQKWIQIILKSLSQNIESSSIIKDVNDIHAPDQNNDERKKGRMYTEFEMKKIVQDLKEGTRYTNAIQRLDKFIKSNPGYDWKKSLAKEGLQFTSKVNSDLDKFRKGQLEMSHNNNMSGISGNNTTSSIENKQPGQMSLQERMQYAREKQNELNNSMNKQDAFKNKMQRFSNQRNSVIQQPIQGMNSNTPSQQNLNTSFSEMNRNLSNKWAQINQSNRGQLTGREQMSGGNNLANTMRHTTASTPGTGNLLNTSSGGFKNRLQNKFANKQNNNSSLGGAVMDSGAETGTIGQKISPQKIGGMQQQNSQAQLNRSSNAGGISNKSFRDRLKGIKTGQQNAQGGGASVTGLASTQGPASVGMGSGAATNQDLQKRLADMKAKLHGLRNKE